MNKIKYELLDKIINDKELSKMEINVLIYLAKRCSDAGILEGAYYKEVIKDAHVGTTQFYNILKSLQTKGYITTSKDFSMDIDITLLNNSFVAETGEINYRGYLNLNMSLFDDEKFYAIRAGSKRLLLALVKKTVNDMARKNKEKSEPKIFISPYNLYKIYADKLHVSKKTVKSYFKEIKDFVSVYHDKVYTRKIIMTIKADVLEASSFIIGKKKALSKKEKKVDRFDSDLSFISMLCRRNRIDSTEQSRIDAARLVSQFLNKANDIGQGIRSIMARAIDNVKGVLNAKGLNKYIHDYIEKFKSNQTSFTPYKEPALATGTYNNYKNSFNNFSQRKYDYDAVEKAWLQHHGMTKDCKYKNSFNNFPQRTYDYDAVEKRLLQKTDNERLNKKD